MKTFVVSLRFMLVITLLLGGVYPLVTTLLGQGLFSHQANGSLLTDGNKVVGSSLIGQDFSAKPEYFQGRPSATSPAYNPSASGASNLSPVSSDFAKAVSDRVKAWKAVPGAPNTPIPAVLITASASGVDPQIDLDSALWQVPIVAQARKIADSAALEALIRQKAVKPGFPWDPPAFVNVLDLNLSLDKLFPKP